MPNVSTYVSDQDFTKYLEIKNQGRGAWTQFISAALSKDIQFNPKFAHMVETTDVTLMVPKKRSINLTDSIAAEIKRVQKDKDEIATAGNLCKKHGTPLDDRGRCLQKGH